MAFKIERNDITRVSAEAIVNTANFQPIVGEGTDAAIYNAAGLEALLSERKKIGVIEKGHCVATSAFNLSSQGVKYLIHTVGTKYKSENLECVKVLKSCYASSLQLAKSLGCKSVAIPLLATGVYGFPKELGLKIAIDEISSFLLENEIDVTLVVYDKDSYLISEKLFCDIQDFLQENLEDDYAQEQKVFSLPPYKKAKTYNRKPKTSSSKQVQSNKAILSKPLKKETCSAFEQEPIQASFQEHLQESKNVESFIKQNQATLNFQNTLKQHIADKKIENSVVYKKAYVDKKFFSKIISNKNYVPKKQTVMALGLALELKIEDFEAFLASAGYAFMPSSKFDLVVKYCVINKIYNLLQVDTILYDHNLKCFASE